MASEYWYDESTTKSELEKLKNLYNDVVTNALKVGELLKSNVNVANIWNDDNSKVFASWWNQNGKEGGAGGKLIWDETHKRLYMSSQSDSQSDGEDRIRHTVSACAVAYYFVTCRAFVALESSHSESLKKYSAYIEAGKDSTYRIKENYYGGVMWPNLLSKKFGCKAWKNTALELKNHGVNSDADKIKVLGNNLAKKLKNLNSSVEDFSREVMKIATNTDRGRYWGFSTELTMEVVKKVKETNLKTEKWLTSFAHNTNTALSNTTNATIGDLKSLSKISFK